VKAVWPKPSRQASEAYMSKRQVWMHADACALATLWRRDDIPPAQPLTLPAV